MRHVQRPGGGRWLAETNYPVLEREPEAITTTAEPPRQTWRPVVRASHGWLLLLLLPLPLVDERLLTWPLYLVVPLAIYAAAATLLSPLRRTYPTVRAGRLGWRVLGDTALLSATTTALFVLLCCSVPIDLSNLRVLVPHWGVPLLAVGGLVFVIVNSFLEELIWRGVVYGALASQFGRPAALVLQAVGFGLSHIFFLHAVALGVGLAFVYGLLLGRLRQQSGGLAAPVLAHAAMDLTLLVLVVSR